MKIETYEGKIERDIYGSWDDCDPGLYFGSQLIEALFSEFVGKKVKVTIEEIKEEEEEEEDEEPKILFKLKTLVKKDAICDELGLNPWCVAEGADGEEEIPIKLSQAKKWGLLS